MFLLVNFKRISIFSDKFLLLSRVAYIRLFAEVYGIPLLDTCSDHNITSRMCGHVGGHAYSVSVLKWLLDWHIQYPNLRHICRVHIQCIEAVLCRNRALDPF